MPAFDFQSYITDIPDYPKPGVIFKDVTTLFKDPDGFAAAIDAIAEHFEGKGITKVVGAEARGFMIGAPVAYRLHAGSFPLASLVNFLAKLVRKVMSLNMAPILSRCILMLLTKTISSLWWMILLQQGEPPLHRLVWWRNRVQKLRVLLSCLNLLF